MNNEIKKYLEDNITRISKNLVKLEKVNEQVKKDCDLYKKNNKQIDKVKNELSMLNNILKKCDN